MVTPPVFPAAIGLGSNVGDRQRFLSHGCEKLSRLLHSCRASRIYESEPMYVSQQPVFLNQVVVGETNLSPEHLLEQLKRIERNMGRQNRYLRGPREIDLDILLYADKLIATDLLRVPHPGLAERPFVLMPLAEISPDWQCPPTGVTVETLRRNLSCSYRCKPISEIQNPSKLNQAFSDRRDIS